MLCANPKPVQMRIPNLFPLGKIETNFYAGQKECASDALWEPRSHSSGKITSVISMVSADSNDMLANV